MQPTTKNENEKWSLSQVDVVFLKTWNLCQEFYHRLLILGGRFYKIVERGRFVVRLLNIRDTVQQVAEAVAAVLKVEVEIADEHLMRVADTGKAQMNVLRTMAGEDHVYQSALRTGEPLIIQNPGFNEICKPCMHYGNCRENR